MNKVKVNFKSISEIVGTSDIGLLVLVDEKEERQLAVTCDKQMIHQLSLRLQQVPEMEKLLPEVLVQVIGKLSDDPFELVISALKGGEYKAMLINTSTLDIVPIKVGDAILLSVISDIPLFVEQGLMLRQSIPYTVQAKGMKIPVNALTDEMLSSALAKAVEDENYELATHLRDEINRRKADQ